jgi:hypothetical protein
MMKCLLSIACAAVLVMVQALMLPAQGQLGVKTFRNSYIEFQIPDAWDCQREDNDFVCQETNRKTVDMIAIVTAKVVDPQRDNPAVYASQLAQPREWKNSAGKVVVSSEIRSGTQCYDGRLWQWAHHYQSEIQNYYTDYFVRIEGNIAALVTVSYYRAVEADGSALAAAITRRLHMISSSTGQDQLATEC